MTLKGFHIVFITCSTLLALCLGGWCIWLNMMIGGSGYIVGALCSFAAAIALFLYGIWFYRKMKRLRIFT
jgi:hypothetical protein